MPQSIEELEEKYPMAFKYLLAKKPKGIALSNAWVQLTGINDDIFLRYNEQDLKMLNQLILAVNLKSST